MLRTTALFASLLTLARPASAGDCSDGGPDVIKAIEAYARSKAKTPPPDIDQLCVQDGVAPDPKLVKRFLAACETIIARDPKDLNCIGFGIELGAKKLGSFDLFDAVGTVYKVNPFQYQDPATQLYRRLDDARAVPVLRTHWQTALTDKRASSTNHNTVHNYTVFRHAVIKLMTAHGGKPDSELLTEQLKGTKDPGLKKAMTKALAEIDKRLAAAPP